MKEKCCETCISDGTLKGMPPCNVCYNVTGCAPTKWRPNDKYEPMTNADRIRSMELKPCRYCGGKAVIRSRPFTHDKFLAFCLDKEDKCPVKPSTNWCETAEEAAEEWNRSAGEKEANHEDNT